MRTSLSLILFAGLSLAAICEKIRLPRIVGMIVAGILLGVANTFIMYYCVL